ncbi:MAG: hypothetical protein AB3N20_00865 [Rhizobiaceae bacterium]
MRSSSWPAAIFSACLLASVSGSALAAERWSSVEGQATAQLPPPTRTKTIDSAQLNCAEQKWQLILALMPEAQGANGDRRAITSVGSERFETAAKRDGNSVAVDLPSDALPPLRAGIRMDVSVTGGEIDHRARFSLIGSRRTIDEIAPRCSKRDMSAYKAILPGELNPEATLARELLADEIKAFRSATKSAPSVAAALEPVDGGRRLLFATLCGSSWYYGNSGCNMTIHAQSGNDDWTRVYETEGVSMHIDPKSQSQGWPNLVALTFDGDEIIWSWMGGSYQPPIVEELRGG